MSQPDLDLQPLVNSPIRLSTEDIPASNRQAWLSEVIGREYANVKITPPKKVSCLMKCLFILGRTCGSL